VAAAAVAALAIALVSLIRGDRGSPLELAGIRLTQAQKALLPWRAVVPNGSAGYLDARGLPGPAAQQAAIDRYQAIGLPIYCAGGRGNYAALTFDDGPSPQFTDRVLQILRDGEAQGTFFLVGRQLKGSDEIARRQLEMGAVGDHTWNHPILTRLSNRDVMAELQGTKRALERAVGEPVTLFRAPFAAHDPRVDARIRRFGLLHILWDVDTRDSAGAGSEEIVLNAEAGLRPGAIILMHETYERSVRALPQIIASARRRGLQLVSVPQLLALDPPPDAQVRAGGAGCGHRERYQQAEDANGMRLSGGGSGAPER
jgi:peptidoglycan/xylan/chitin deacetylase (PgdA/CDA1 family)